MSNRAAFRYLRTGVLSTIMLSVLLMGCAMTQPELPLNERVSTLAVQVGAPVAVHETTSEQLRVVSLNLAHGRGDNFTQFLTSSDAHRAYLMEAGDFLKKVDADVVALQEVDAPSRWSGNFDHLAFLANHAEYPLYVRTNHVQGYLATYGTGLLSKQPIIEGIGFDFQPSPPTTNKGFTLAQVSWLKPGDTVPQLIDVISVHLDFSRDSVRREQIKDLETLLNTRPYPKVIMGDFNSEWLAREFMANPQADSSPIKSYHPESDQFKTYEDKRLDWILISKELEFVSYRVDGNVPSDHRAVIAEIRFSQSVE